MTAEARSPLAAATIAASTTTPLSAHPCEPAARSYHYAVLLPAGPVLFQPDSGGFVSACNLARQHGCEVWDAIDGAPRAHVWAPRRIA